MGDRRWTIARKWRYGGGRALWATSLAVAGGLLVPGIPASAQEQAAGPPPSDLCQVRSIEIAEASQKELHAFCRGRALILGWATSFQTSDNEALKATLVDVRLGADRRILLLSFLEDGTPQAEDVTGQVALSVGRGPMAAIDGVDLDLTSFAQTGEIGVSGAGTGRISARGARIDLGRQIADERARRQVPASPVRQ